MRRNGFACSPGRACPGLISPRSSRSSTCSSPIWTCSCCARWLRRIAAAAGARIRSGRNGNGASSPINQRAPLAAVPKPRSVVAPAKRCLRPLRTSATSWTWQKPLSSGVTRPATSVARARATEVAGRVTPLESGFCHVQLVADVRNGRRQRLAGATTLLGLGTAASGALWLMGLLAPFPFLPLLILAPAAAAILRSHRAQHEHVQIGLEQVLDRLERGEIKPGHAPPGEQANPFLRIADEIRTLINPR